MHHGTRRMRASLLTVYMRVLVVAVTLAVIPRWEGVAEAQSTATTLVGSADTSGTLSSSLLPDAKRHDRLDGTRLEGFTATLATAPPG
ncbi:MAG: hypothetical protein OXS29_19365 [bacterium]|nr:hypothetical protein [bacterium]MDE0439950.1 hypothetical protein [bacterium]